MGLFLIGIIDENIILELRHRLGMDVFIVKESARGSLVEDVVNNPESFKGKKVWHSRKFVLMHNLSNSEIKSVLSVFKSLGLKDVIFATTTETSLKWKLEDLLLELIKEDEYFKNRKANSK